MSSELPDSVIAETAHLRFLDRRGWSFVERKSATGVVCVAGITGDRRVILVEQYRTPVDCRVIELPAGLAGDLSNQQDEHLSNAARRELLEETGFESNNMRAVATLASSAGLTNEVVTIFVADQLMKTAPGGGDDREEITVHEIALDEIDDWLRHAQRSGKLVDARVYSGLYLLRQEVASLGATSPKLQHEP